MRTDCYPQMPGQMTDLVTPIDIDIASIRRASTGPSLVTDTSIASRASFVSRAK